MRILHLVSYAVYSGPVPGLLALARAQRAQGHEVWVAHDRLRGPFSPYEEAIDADHLAAAGQGGVLPTDLTAPPAPAPPLENAATFDPVPPARNAAVRNPAPPTPQPWATDLTPPVALAVSPKAAPWHFVRDVLRLRRFVRKFAIDVVHAHLSHDHWLLACCGKLGAARVRTVHAERALQRRFGHSWLWGRTDGVVLRARGHKGRLAGVGLDRGAPRALVPGAIDAGFWRPPARAERSQRGVTRAALGIPGPARLVVHAALMADRGQLELLAALEQLCRAGAAGELHVALVGRGPQEDEVAARAAAPVLRGRVHRLGYLEANALRAVYRAADAAFVAQPGNDGAARAALEAMAAGLPVVAVRRGPLAELVDEVVGYPVADRAPDHVARGLAAWLADPDRARARGRAGRRRILRQRTFAQEAEATLRLYAQARVYGGGDDPR